MEWVRTIVLVLPIVVAVTAVLVARRHRSHMAFAVGAAWVAAADWIRIVVAFGREEAPRPYTGFARLSFHVDQLLVFSWSFVLVALALHYFTRLRVVWAVLPFVAAFAICLDYPAVRGESLALLFRVASLATCLMVWGAIVWAMIRRDDLQPTISHLVVMFWAAVEVIVSAVPFASDFFRDWDMVRMANIVAALACVAAQVWLLVRGRTNQEAPA